MKDMLQKPFFNAPRGVGDTLTIEVMVGAKSLLDEYFSEYYQGIVDNLSIKVEAMRFTYEELQHYLMSMLKYRVMRSRGERFGGYGALNECYVPSFYHTFLSCIGCTYDHERNIMIRAELQYDPLDVEECVRFSTKLFSQTNGVGLVHNPIPSGNGKLDVMSTILVEDYLRSYLNVDNQMDLIVSAYAALHLQQSELLNSLFRIEYGARTTLAYLPTFHGKEDAHGIA